uniref:Uncharacterized protein n=1 Tax=Ditylenchus dipsaci TaxID=166011 RepID=A0A915CMN9_9BILA
MTVPFLENRLSCGSTFSKAIKLCKQDDLYLRSEKFPIPHHETTFHETLDASNSDWITTYREILEDIKKFSRKHTLDSKNLLVESQNILEKFKKVYDQLKEHYFQHLDIFHGVSVQTSEKRLTPLTSIKTASDKISELMRKVITSLATGHLRLDMKDGRSIENNIQTQKEIQYLVNNCKELQEKVEWLETLIAARENRRRLVEERKKKEAGKNSPSPEHKLELLKKDQEKVRGKLLDENIKSVPVFNKEEKSPKILGAKSIEKEVVDLEKELKQGEEKLKKVKDDHTRSINNLSTLIDLFEKLNKKAIQTQTRLKSFATSISTKILTKLTDIITTKKDEAEFVDLSAKKNIKQDQVKAEPLANVTSEPTEKLEALKELNSLKPSSFQVMDPKNFENSYQNSKPVVFEAAEPPSADPSQQEKVETDFKLHSKPTEKVKPQNKTFKPDLSTKSLIHKTEKAKDETINLKDAKQQIKNPGQLNQPIVSDVMIKPVDQKIELRKQEKDSTVLVNPKKIDQHSKNVDNPEKTTLDNTLDSQASEMPQIS